MGSRIAAVVVLWFLLAGVAQAGPVLKISILTSGAVLLNGEPTTLPQLDTRLRAAKAQGGEVLYYREDAYYFPGPTALEVFDLLIRYRMKTSLSSKADFSDYLDPVGLSHSRGRLQ
ncbi:MAG TPA: hypothetical protein VMH32_26700 [Burkholderiales bacterium]|nr:hypothetical protein [Burkholderiales bacterium]